MIKKAKNVPIGSEGLIFLPYLTGERCPYPDPYARGVFFGLSLKHTKEHIIRSVLEGITFGLRDSVEIMKEINLPIGEKFIASGGGGKSDFWCQMMADIFGKKIVRLICQEGAPFGAAILASVGTGFYDDVKTACKKIIKEKDEFDFNEKNVKIYEKFYGIYRKLYPNLKDLFGETAKIL
jgi:xylulokinase